MKTLSYWVICQFFYVSFFKSLVQRFCIRELKLISLQLLKLKKNLSFIKDKNELVKIQQCLTTAEDMVVMLSEANNHFSKSFCLKCLSCIDELRRIETEISLYFKNFFGRKSIYTIRWLRSGVLRGGCYCCSQPVFKVQKRQKIVINSKEKNVFLCQTCKESLYYLESLKTLYFFAGNEKIHWSKCDNYLPSCDHWDINKIKIKKSNVVSLSLVKCC